MKKMKKLLAVTLALAMALTVIAACGNNSNGPSGGNGSNGNDNRTPSSNNGGSGDGNQNSGNQSAGSVSQSAMENAVAGHLSKIGGPSSITLCGGGSIKYEPENEFWTGWGEVWSISEPEMTSAELCDLVEGQLADYGFIKDYGLTGYKFIKKAGTQGIGIEIAMDGSVLDVRMTHFPSQYSMSYIEEMNESMPKIIPARSAEEVLPENFSISWEMSYGYRYTLVRKDGDWLYCTDGRYTEDAGEWSKAYYSVALLQNDGSYKYYQYDEDQNGNLSTPRESDNFTSSVESNFQAYLNNIFDCSYPDDGEKYGYGMDISLSTWVQMSEDFGKEAGSSSANMRHSIPENMVIDRTEVIAGVTCDVARSESWWTTYEYAYDPGTGVLFRYSVTEDEETEDKLLVYEYSSSPSSLGNFPGA